VLSEAEVPELGEPGAQIPRWNLAGPTVIKPVSEPKSPINSPLRGELEAGRAGADGALGTEVCGRIRRFGVHLGVLLIGGMFFVAGPVLGTDV
jgi:hypothetical protein